MKRHNLYIVLAILPIMTGCKDTEYNSAFIPALNQYFLSVSSDNINVSSAGSSAKYEIRAADNYWTIEGNASWLTFSSTNGKGSQSIDYTIKENLSSDTARVCVMHVSSEEGLWRKNIPITISQAKATPYINIGNYEAIVSGSSHTFDISVDANMKWSVSSDADWISASKSNDGKSINVRIDENITGMSRKADITIRGNIAKNISITQQAADISANIGKVTFRQIGGKEFVNITSEATWKAQTSASWIDVRPSSGSAGKTEISITTNENEATEPRTDFVYVLVGNKKNLEITVEQEGLYLNLPVTNLSYTSVVESKSIFLSSNSDWAVTSCPDWITVSMMSGNGDAELSVNSKDNPSVNNRQGTIVFENNNHNIKRIIDVVQAGKTFDIDTQELTFSDKQGSQRVSISSDANWTASASEKWITVSPTASTGNGELTISVTENTDTLDRTGYVNVTTYDKAFRIAVMQDSKYIRLSAEAFNFSSEASNASFSFKSNYEWSAKVESEITWMVIMPKSGSGDGNITIAVTENNTPDTRTAKLYLSTRDSYTYIIDVSQDGRYLTSDHSEINFFRKGGSEVVNVSTDVDFTISKSGNWFGYTRKGNAVTIIASENNTGANREGSITFSMTGISSGSYSLTIPVKQEK